MTSLKIRVSLIAFVLGAYLVLPVGASQGKGNGGGGSTPPTLPPTPVTVVNSTAVDCYSGAGCLDPAFGSLGRLQQNVGGAVQNMSLIAIRADGKIVAAGTHQPDLTIPSDMSCVVGRFLPDGSIDSSFGSGGLVDLNLISGSSYEFLFGLAVQDDGKIVVAVGASVGGGVGFAQAIRLTATGSLNPTFGSGGRTALASSSATLGGLVLQPDGRIVVALNSTAGFTQVTRLLPDGTLDRKFGQQGSRLIADLSPHAVTLQSTGKIVLAGAKSSGADAVVTRLTSSGTVDTSFGTSGSTVVDFCGRNDGFIDISIASDDSIVAGGYADSNGTAGNAATLNASIARFNANGALTSSFGSFGRVVLDMHGGFDSVRAVNLREDGRVEFVGWAGLSTTKAFPVNLVVGRLTATGTLDSSFGAGGVTETATGLLSSQALATAVGPDGLLTVGGVAFNVTTLSSDRWLLARYFR